VIANAGIGLVGVVAVLTAHDLPIPNAQAAAEARDIVMAYDRVLHVGQPVVAVLAETEGAAEDAADLVTVQYEELPAVVDFIDSLTTDVPVLEHNRELSQESWPCTAPRLPPTSAGDSGTPNVGSRTSSARRRRRRARESGGGGGARVPPAGFRRRISSRSRARSASTRSAT
jgi:CO/xanthine dehydrogenase Mo-binding subunit